MDTPLPLDPPISATSCLARLHGEIDARVSAMRGDQGSEPDWPCAKGCDRCCRELADLPRLTRTEWLYLKEGLAVLSGPHRETIHRAVVALGPAPVRPVTCPLLDRETGACPVYIHRPVACRTYGYYLERGIGLYCRDIREKVAAGAWPEVIWGNQEAIDRRLSALGETRSLAEWFADDT